MIRVFSHYIPIWFLCLALAEALVFLGAGYLGEVSRFIGVHELRWQIGADSLHNVIVFPLLMLFNMGIVGLYQRNPTEGPSGVLLRITIAFALAAVAMGLVNLAFPGVVPWRRSLLVAFSVSALGVLVARAVFYRLLERENLGQRVLVLGTGGPARKIIELAAGRGAGFTVVGCLEHAGDPLEVAAEHRIAATDMPLADYCRLRGIDEIVVAVSDRRNVLPMNELLDCKLSGVRIMEYPHFFERETGRVMMEHLYPSWFVYSDGFRGGPLHMYLKRGFDVLVSLALVLVTWPLMLLTALAILVEDGWRSDILYRQRRMGERGRIFEVVKFRSMRPDAEADGVARWARPDDERVTRIGRLIRKARIDELPQLFNVLKGEMSFVGPRPERPEFVATLTERIPYYGERHRVRPGITGWAQVCYSYGASEEDAVEKLKFDLYYLKNHSIFLDFLILLRTFEVIMWGRGAR